MIKEFGKEGIVMGTGIDDVLQPCDALNSRHVREAWVPR